MSQIEIGGTDMIEQLIAFFMTVASGIELYFAYRFSFLQKKNYRENRMLSAACLSSGIWAISYAVFLLSDNPVFAGYVHKFAMGFFLTWIIMIVALVNVISGIEYKFRRMMRASYFFGTCLYIFTIFANQMSFYRDKIGMAWKINNWETNLVFVLYHLVMSLWVFGVCIYIIRNRKEIRLHTFAKQAIGVNGILVVGLVFDGIAPAYEISSISMVTIMQFIGMALLIRAVTDFNAVRIDAGNISNFVYHSIKQPVLGFDQNRQLQLVNSGAGEFLGIEQENIGKKTSISDWFDIDEETVFSASGYEENLDTVCIVNGIWCSLSVNSLSDKYGDPIGYIVVFSDMTERKRMLAQMEEAMHTAEEANLAKSRFLANMSHEIRTPMNAIIGLSELLYRSMRDENSKEYVADIRNSSLNLLAIINDILDLSKIETGKMELVCDEFYLGNVLRDVYLVIDTQAQKKGLNFSMDVSSEIPNKLYGDSVRIRSVLVNILNNSVKYTKHGSVLFKAEVLEKDEENVTIRFISKDTGVGIHEEEIPYVFESFSQVDKKLHQGVEGSGLGLSIVKGYVDLMGGNISVDSVYGEGSTFTIELTLPIVDAELINMDGEMQAVVEDVYSIGNIRVKDVDVLVVDDNLINLKVAKKSMEIYGLNVQVANSGAEALEKCKEKNFDIVFLDQLMPEMDGLQCMQQLRQINDHYKAGGIGKVVILTANAIAGVREEMLNDGFDEYLGKPINFQSLERILQLFVPEEKRYIETEEDKQEGLDERVEKIKTVVPELQVERALKYFGESVDAYIEVLSQVVRLSEKQLAKIRKLDDLDQFTISIHAIKGQLLNIGADDLAEQAKMFEMAGKDGDLSFIQDNILHFIDNYREFVVKLRLVVPKPEEETTEPKQLKLCHELIDCLEGYDIAGMSSRVKKLEKEQLLPEEVLSVLKKYMDDFDMVGMLHTIKAYISSND